MFQFPVLVALSFPSFALKQIPKSVNVTARLFCETFAASRCSRLVSSIGKLSSFRSNKRDYMTQGLPGINAFLILIYIFLSFFESKNPAKRETQNVIHSEQRLLSRQLHSLGSDRMGGKTIEVLISNEKLFDFL
jgi:hypothetical protein